MNAALPRLRRITGEYAVAGDVKIRPADLYVSHRLSPARRRPGRRRLCGHLPGHRHRHRQGVHRRQPSSATSISPPGLRPKAWSEAKIASFYDDPVKQACDAWSMAKAFSFRKVTIDNGLYWRAQRWARFLAWFGEGTLAAAAQARIGADVNAAALISSSSSSSSSSSLSSSA